MKKRLPWIGTVLVSLFLLYLEFVFWYSGAGVHPNAYFTVMGVVGVIYGSYRVIFPDKKDDKKE